MRKRIGEFLIEKGLLNQAQVTHILKYSQETGLRFGEAGMDLGVLTRESMIELFGPSYAVDFFHLETEYFPKITRDLLSLDAIIRLGALPLGFKTERKFFRTRKILNVGLLDPGRKDAAAEAMQAAIALLGENEVQGTKVFLVLADQFLSVLKQVYGTGVEELRKRDPAQVDPTLSLFLDLGH